jgi:hypothetical protein
LKLTDKQVDAIHAARDKAVAEFIEGLPALIHDRLEKAVASSLGFSTDSWNKKWEIDHCNGRTSHISSLVSDRTKQVVAALIQQLGADFEISEAQRSAILKEFSKKLHERTSSLLEEMLSEKAHRLAEATIKATIKEACDVTVVDDIKPPQVNIADPRDQGPLTSILTALMVREGFKEEEKEEAE